MNPSSMTWTPDECQQIVINVCSGQHLVLASPGCGKTQILTERVRKAHLSGVEYGNMLCLTFTNRAARGMRERIDASLGEGVAEQLYVGNVHRFCSRFLYEQQLIAAESSVLDEKDALSVLSRFTGEDEVRLMTDRNRQKECAQIFQFAAFMYQLSHGHPRSLRLHPECVTPEDITAMRKLCMLQHTAFDSSAMLDMYAHPDTYRDTLSTSIDYGLMNIIDRLLRKMELAGKYQEYKRVNHLLDFEDLLLLTYDALIADTACRYKRYSWIQVDEVQDLNPLQLTIIDCLMQPDATVVYLGDEQQAIFSFMGAKEESLKTLRKRCGNNIHFLDTNHRSPGYLLEVFNAFASNVLGIEPTLLPRPFYNPVPVGNELQIIYSNDYDSEIDDVLRQIRNLEHYNPDETTAVIVSSNADAEKISQRMDECEMAHFKVSGEDLFASDGVKLLFAHLNVMVSETNFLAWSRLLKGLHIFGKGSAARNFVRASLDRAIVPSDYLRYTYGKTYVQDFVSAYEEEDIIVFDTETTGLDIYADDIVQIAATRLSRGKKVADASFKVYLKTSRRIPEMLGDIPNPLIEEIKYQTLADPAEGLRMFMDFVGDSILLAHNAEYDYQILLHNLERHCPDIDLRERCPRYFDSLKIIRLLHPELKAHKLKSLLEELHLEGANTHLADDDVDATCNLVRYCHGMAQQIIPLQQEFFSRPRVKECVEPFRERYADIYMAALGRLYCRDSVRPSAEAFPESTALVRELLLFHAHVNKLGYVPHLRGLQYIAAYLANDLVCADEEPSLYEQLQHHVMEMNTLKEADLCGSSCMDEHIFVTTVHKAKGLEFDNVIVFDAVEGRYPSAFNRGNTVRMLEDARKFYVAISRARKRLYVAYGMNRSSRRGDSYTVELTPFMNTLLHFFGS